MTPKERVRKELKELIVKQKKLETFIKENMDFKKLSPTNQSLLQQQYAVMTEYRHILVLRLHYWVK